MKEILNTLSVWILPFIISVILIFGACKKVPVYETFTKGAKEGFWVAVNYTLPCCHNGCSCHV